MKNLLILVSFLISTHAFAQTDLPSMNWFKDSKPFNDCMRDGVARMIADVPNKASTLFSLATVIKAPVKQVDPIGNIEYTVSYGFYVNYKPGLGDNYFAQEGFCMHTVPANSPRDYMSSSIPILDTRLTDYTISCGSVIDFAKKTVIETVPVFGTNFSLNYSSEFNAETNVNRRINNSYSFFRNINSVYRVERFNGTTEQKLASTDYPISISSHFSNYFQVPSSSTLWVRDQFKSVARIRTDLLGVERGNGPVFCTYKWEENASGTLTLRTECSYPEESTYLIESIADTGVLYHPEVWGLNGWTVSDHHYFDSGSLTLFSGAGERISYTTSKFVNDPTLGEVLVLINKRNEQELFIFDLQGRHLETRDAFLGHVVHKFAYDVNNKLISIADRFNSKTNFIYSGNLLQKIVSPYGVETKFQVNQSKIVNVLDPEGFSFEMTYDSFGLLSTFKSNNGVVTAFVYNSDGEFIREDKNNGLIQYFTQFVIDGVSVLTKNVNFGLVRKVEIASNDQNLIANELDQNNNLISQQLRSHIYNITQFNFEQEKNTEVFSPSNEWGQDKIIVNQSVRQITESDQNVTALAEHSENRTYDVSNNILKLQRYQSVSSNENYVVQTTFDKSKNEITATDNVGNASTVQFNVNNLASRITNVDAFPTDLQYDSKGRLIKVTKGTQFESFIYDVHGYLASTNNNKNQITQFIRNKKGQLLKKVLPNRDTIEFEYSDGGAVKKIIAPNGQIHNFGMSLGDYVTQVISPNNKSTVFDYDSDKRLKSIIKPSGKTLSYEYEPGAGGLKKISMPNGPILINERDIRSRIKSITSPDNIKLNFTWASNQIQSQSWYDNGELIAKLESSFYEDMFKVKTIFLNEYLVASYNYQNGVLSSIDNLGFTYSNQIDANARIQKISNNSGFSIEYVEQDTLSGDQPEQLITARIYDGAESQLYITLKRAYDNFGQATEFTTTTLNQATGTYNSYFSLMPVYDINNRLVQLNKTRKSFVNGQEVNSLDFVNQYLYPAGSNNNIKTYQQSISVNHTQSPIKRTVASHNNDDQLTKLQGSINRDYKYNEDGELSEMTNCFGSTKYEYDSLANLKKVIFPNGKTIEYKVDAFNRRFKKIVNGQTVEYYLWYDQNRLAAVLDGSKNPKVMYVYGAESANVPGYVIKNGKTYKIIHDPGTQSVRYIVDSENAMIVQESEYDEHGNIMKNTNAEFQSLGFAGGLYDSDTKFIRFGARDYDPTVGRWTTKDPIGFAGGDTNLYAYVAGDPMSYVDPEGLCPCGNAKNLLQTARSDKRDWSENSDRSDVNSGFGVGTSKCNLYADTQYENSGYNLPNTGGTFVSQLLGLYPPGAKTLSDPKYELDGWVVVSGPPQAGDLLAFEGHVGIATGNGTSISASPRGVVENKWGFRNRESPIVRRCQCPN